MRQRRWFLAGTPALLVAVGLVLAALVVSGSEAAPRAAAAQIQRTFVATSGNDANPCTRTEPCRNFAAAIANTLSGGEVVALDSGGYGSFTVDKPLTVAGAPGAHVAVTSFAGNGVTVDSAGKVGAVVLRNLYLTGLGGQYGIRFIGGTALRVESVVATGFSTYGLLADSAGAGVHISDSSFPANGANGIYVKASDTRAEIESTRADANGSNGMRFDVTTVSTVSNSAATQNGIHGIFVSNATVDISRSQLSHNAGSGLFLVLGIARISESTVNGNLVGLDRNGGAVESYGDNVVSGNATNTSGTITMVGKT